MIFSQVLKHGKTFSWRLSYAYKDLMTVFCCFRSEAKLDIFLKTPKIGSNSSAWKPYKWDSRFWHCYMQTQLWVIAWLNFLMQSSQILASKFILCSFATQFDNLFEYEQSWIAHAWCWANNRAMTEILSWMRILCDTQLCQVNCAILLSCQ